MTKRKYGSPVLFENGGLTPDEDPTISFGASQGTSGYDSIFTFDQEVLDDDLFGLYSDEEFADMDTNGDGHISWDEYQNYQP